MKVGNAVNHVFISKIWITRTVDYTTQRETQTTRLIYEPNKIKWIKDDDGSFRLQIK